MSSGGLQRTDDDDEFFITDRLTSILGNLRLMQFFTTRGAQKVNKDLLLLLSYNEFIIYRAPNTSIFMNAVQNILSERSRTFSCNYNG
jgi:hypothetical protein